MFKLNLVLRRKNDDIMIFSPAPWFRVLFLAVAVFIILGIITIVSDGSGSDSYIVPAIIAGICVIASLYEESWTFNRREMKITAKTGLLFLNKAKNIPFSDVERLDFEVFIRGGRTLTAVEKKTEEESEEPGARRRKAAKKYYQNLRLTLKSGDSIEIENTEGYNTDILKQKAWILSDFCGFELRQ